MSVNNFGLFFTRDGTVIRVPVNPEKLPVARDNDNSEYNVLGIGPIMIPRIPKLREVTISSFFPGREFSGINQWGTFHPPEYYIQFFESAMNDKAPIIYTPVRYYENGEPFMTGDTGFEVLVTQFNPGCPVPFPPDPPPIPGYPPWRSLPLPEGPGTRGDCRGCR